MTAATASPRLLTGELLDELSPRAAAAPRRRLNLNLHQMDDAVHRLFNAIEPSSYVRPHRHQHPPRSETVLVVRGALGLVVFGDEGDVRSTSLLAAAGEVFGADLPPGAWHTLVSLTSGTVFFETKAGPYAPIPVVDTAPWAPHEGSPEAARFLSEWRKLFAVR